MFYATCRRYGLIRLGPFETLRVRGKFPLRTARIREVSDRLNAPPLSHSYW